MNNIFIDSITTSDDVSHFPVWLSSEEKEGEDLYIYYKPHISSKYHTSNKSLNNLISNLQDKYYVYNTRIEKEDSVMNIYIKKGYIIDEKNNILLCLTTNDLKVSNSNHILKDESLRLYISNQLVNNPLYKSLYNKLQKDYIIYYQRNDVDIFYMSSKKIEQELFKSPKIFNFKTIEQMNNYLNSKELNKLLFKTFT